jgi:hypothetical protein
MSGLNQNKVIEMLEAEWRDRLKAAVLAEREACAEIAEIAEPYKCADLIRARNAT